VCGLSKLFRLTPALAADYLAIRRFFWCRRELDHLALSFHVSDCELSDTPTRVIDHQ